MNTAYGLTNNNYNKYGFDGYSAGQFNYVQGNYAKTNSADITIVTDDGDRVTISSEKSLETSSLSLSITGDLDKEEYEDVLAAVKTIESLMEKPFTGSMEDLAKLAKEFGGFDTLSSLDASIKFEESMSYEQTQAVVSEVEKPKGEGSKGRSELAKMDHALDTILKSAKKSGKSNDSVRSMMDDYLSELLAMFSGKADKNDEGKKAGQQMKDMIMKRLDEKAGPETQA
jgi:hypothetical protein